jgi:hypothetical protein
MLHRFSQMAQYSFGIIRLAASSSPRKHYRSNAKGGITVDPAFPAP